MPDEHPLHPKLLAALEAEDQAQLTEVLAGARAADIAESFDLLDDENRSHVLFALPPHTAAEVVIMLDEAVRGDVVDDLDTESLTEIVSALPPDDAADVLGELTEEEADEILDHMVDEQSDKIEELLTVWEPMNDRGEWCMDDVKEMGRFWCPACKTHCGDPKERTP